jgi:Flp pilus assembly protein TadG
MTEQEGKKNRRKEKGQSIVEFALVLPLFLIVMFIIADFGVGFSRWLVVTNAAREGARFGTVGSTAAEIRDRTSATSSGLLDPSDIDVGYMDFEGDGVGPGDAVVVDASYEYTLITPLGRFLDLAFGSLTLSACADMRIEQEIDGAVDTAAEC